MGKTFLDIFDYAGNKLVNVFDSDAVVPGSADGIEVTYELNGSRTLRFEMPYMINRQSNFRWDYIQAQYKIHIVDNDYEDWFIITNPKKQKSSKRIYGEVVCDHLSSILKAKNIYMTFDDENGIDTAQNLMVKILEGTGWHYDIEHSDIFKENAGGFHEGEVKKRTLIADGKTGSYALIGKVCDLFNAYPVFDAVNHTVALYSLNNKRAMWEMTMGRNLTALSVQHDSSDIVTRLYVEGDFDDDDYIGIDGVNPLGLSYLMNFDYYKSIGAFTDQHQAALDIYYERIRQQKDVTFEASTLLTQASSKLTRLWGDQTYLLWTVDSSGNMSNKPIIGGKYASLLEHKQFDVGDTMYIFYHDDTLPQQKDRYFTRKYNVQTKMKFIKENYPQLGENGYTTYIMKWAQHCSGYIGGKEVTIESCEQQISKLRQDNNKDTITDARKQQNLTKIETLGQQISSTYITPSNVSVDVNYSAKIVGIKDLAQSNPVQTRIVRTTVENLENISALSYHFKDDIGIGTLGTDNTVIINKANSRLRFYIKDMGKEYHIGFTKPFSVTSGYEDLASDLFEINQYLLDCSTAGKDLEIVADNNGDIRLNGTTFTFTVKAVPYGLYELYSTAIQTAIDVDDYQKRYNDAIAHQNSIEVDFEIAMGDMLKDGAWTNSSYIAGQEEYLYNDALDILKEMSKPKVTYTVSLAKLSEVMGQTPDDMELNSKIRLWDPELNINDIVYVSKITKYITDPSKNSVEISNEQVNVGSSFDSVFSRVSDIARLIEQRQSVFERAQAISSNGTLPIERLRGAIDIMTTRLESTVSNWYTDENGNIIFETTDGKGAMKLCGDGFMIASGRKEDGTWNWSTKHYWYSPQ